MKRFLALILTLTFCFSLSVFPAETSAESAEKKQARTAEQENVWLYPESTVRMSTYMNFGLGTVSGDWFYGSIFAAKDESGLGRMRLSDLADRMLLSGRKFSFRHLCVDKEWIYFTEGSSEPDTITRISVSGDQEKPLSLNRTESSVLCSSLEISFITQSTVNLKTHRLQESCTEQTWTETTGP